ncbi:hypothetical protein NITHO_5250002 [Nitrolancea hollandica Lb]|uniref:Uncharacterized protein n=1 Tax=Nitrolancea hollandica Lb TaxID=1129897 RepID=I4ELR7_9BACT|nr:hypothetical protein NITHO_5250002 [Nitrolancea hollandica Lb]
MRAESPGGQSPFAPYSDLFHNGALQSYNVMVNPFTRIIRTLLEAWLQRSRVMEVPCSHRPASGLSGMLIRGCCFRSS